MAEWFNDIKAYILFRRDIKREKRKTNSILNTFGIKSNWLGNILYAQINCTDGDFISADYSYDRMLENKLKPIVNYLSSDLGWGDYLVPQISHFVDDEGEPTLSFGVLFIFSGYSLTLSKIIFSILFLIGFVGGSLFIWEYLR
jgi:hypothetical protein